MNEIQEHTRQIHDDRNQKVVLGLRQEIDGMEYEETVQHLVLSGCFTVLYVKTEYNTQDSCIFVVC